MFCVLSLFQMTTGDAEVRKDERILFTPLRTILQICACFGLNSCNIQRL